eukprot:11480140-Karenia_brevis.AAC.1
MDAMMTHVMMDMMMMDVMRSRSGKMLPKPAGGKQRPLCHSGWHTRESEKQANEERLQEKLAKRATYVD